ncbi:hypothetical protein [Acidithiobacillus thiooxidans]|uniref:hypothetical protein n=1 Tax=Acidithiobacillus thiooxidans TaxID=930 RepID=UPI0009DAE88E|nr:hypothetical protein [Acidithiobacillus thiooxidans]
MEIRLGARRLRAISGLCLTFDEEVKNLQRPYLPINEQQYHRLYASGSDFFQIINGPLSGKVVTYGNADGGYVLMPVCQKRAEVLLAAA